MTDVAGIMNITHVAEIVKLTHVARILEARSMYDQNTYYTSVMLSIQSTEFHSIERLLFCLQKYQ